MPPLFLLGGGGGGGNGMFVPLPPTLTPHFYFPLELYVYITLTKNYLTFFIYQLIILWTISINWHRWLLLNNHISKYSSFILVLYRRYINYVSVCPPPPHFLAPCYATVIIIQRKTTASTLVKCGDYIHCLNAWVSFLGSRLRHRHRTIRIKVQFSRTANLHFPVRGRSYSTYAWRGGGGGVQSIAYTGEGGVKTDAYVCKKSFNIFAILKTSLSM